jgi:hypothetical protein
MNAHQYRAIASAFQIPGVDVGRNHDAGEFGRNLAGTSGGLYIEGSRAEIALR